MSLNEIKTEGRCRLCGDNPLKFVLNLLNLRHLKAIYGDDQWRVVGSSENQERGQG